MSDKVTVLPGGSIVLVAQSLTPSFLNLPFFSYFKKQLYDLTTPQAETGFQNVTTELHKQARDSLKWYLKMQRIEIPAWLLDSRLPVGQLVEEAEDGEESKGGNWTDTKGNSFDAEDDPNTLAFLAAEMASSQRMDMEKSNKRRKTHGCI